MDLGDLVPAKPASPCSSKTWDSEVVLFRHPSDRVLASGKARLSLEELAEVASWVTDLEAFYFPGIPNLVEQCYRSNRPAWFEDSAHCGRYGHYGRFPQSE